MATRSTKTSTKTTTRKTAAKPKAATTKTTTKVSTATTKVATAAKTAAKPVAPPKATVVETIKPVVSGAPIKKPELIERVMAETGMKKKDVKPVVEGMLAVLGQSLVKGEELVIPPLGKVMVKRVKDVSNATIMNLKLRHPHAKTEAKEPLAKAAE